jgi:hypothetical protein
MNEPTNGELYIMIQNTEKNLQEFRAETKMGLEKLGDKLDKFIACSDAKFANKWVEKAVWGGCAVIMTGVLVAILNLVIK